MAEKKRKLENPQENVAATEPQGKKAKRESKKEGKKGKKEKKREEHDIHIVSNKVLETEVKEKKGKKEKKEKKSNDVTADDEEQTAAETNGAEPEPEVSQDALDSMDIDGEAEIKEKNSGKEKEKKKDKKTKKEKKKQKEQEQAGEQGNPQSEEKENAEQESKRAAVPKQKAARFIVFVGNLPYSANTESLKAHFEKIQPISVRVATQPDKPTKCRGFGFVEFDNYDRMKTCLKLYHHSSFDDGKYPPRRINVELTAGGGGKSEHRKAKIEYKNQKLAEERKRQAKDIMSEKTKEAKVEEKPRDDYANIHPSRRPRMA
ncbi:hypothetical protein BDW66DRAFT_99207 [Aspergillus desertorum]